VVAYFGTHYPEGTLDSDLLAEQSRRNPSAELIGFLGKMNKIIRERYTVILKNTKRNVWLTVFIIVIIIITVIRDGMRYMEIGLKGNRG